MYLRRCQTVTTTDAFTNANEIWYNNFSTIKSKKANLDSSHTKEIWPLVNFYDTIGVKINKYMRQEIQKLKCAADKRIVLAFKKHKYLGAYLTRSRFA